MMCHDHCKCILAGRMYCTFEHQQCQLMARLDVLITVFRAYARTTNGALFADITR